MGETASGWEPIDFWGVTFYAVLVGEYYSIKPVALFAGEDGKASAERWIDQERARYDDETGQGIDPNEQALVMPVRFLEGQAWNDWCDVPEEGP